MKIGNVHIPGRIFLAPLAGYTSWPFRRICRRLGAALVTTEVVKARELVRRVPATFDIVRFQEDEHPIAAQILSCDPTEAGEAAMMLSEMGFDLIDLNCGCPKRRVLADGLGGALMAFPEKAAKVVEAMCRHAKGPVTVKMRAGPRRGRVTAVETGRQCEAAGAAAICLHPRFAQGAGAAPPDWGLIAQVKRAVSVPVTGNGGIHAPADALRMFQETGCDAVMIGQAAVGKPWIFRQTEAFLESGQAAPSPTQEEILVIVLEHYEGLVAHHGERRATIMMRKQSCHYAKHLHNGKSFNMAVVEASTRAEFMAAVDFWLRRSSRARRKGAPEACNGASPGPCRDMTEWH